MEYFKCFSSKLANNLIRNGFQMLGTEPNMKKPQYDVFLFEKTEKLSQYLDLYFQK